MIIENPIVQYDVSIAAIEDYFKLYNKDREYSEGRLRPVHKLLMDSLLKSQKYYINKNRKKAKQSNNKAIMAIDSDDMPPVVTNNKKLGGKIGMDGSTTWRQISRLIEAGLLEKTYHGPDREYDLYINIHLFGIVDAENKENRVKPNLHKVLEKSKIAKCNHNTVLNSNYSNNKIIDSMESAKADDFEIETKNGNSNGNTENCANPAQQTNPENPLGLNIPESILKNWKQKKSSSKNDVAARNNPGTTATGKKSAKLHKPDPSKTNLQILKAKVNSQISDKELSYNEKMAKREKEIKQMRLSYAVLMVETMLQYLNPTFKAWGNVFADTVSYVADNYFGQLNTFESIAYAWSGYLSRLTDAKRYVERNPGFTPYPGPYFDKTNLDFGFESPKWKNNRKRWEKQSRHKDEERRIQLAIRNYNANPNYNTLNKQIKYLQNNTSSDWVVKGFFKIAYETHKVLPTKQDAN